MFLHPIFTTVEDEMRKEPLSMPPNNTVQPGNCRFPYARMVSRELLNYCQHARINSLSDRRYGCNRRIGVCGLERRRLIVHESIEHIHGHLRLVHGYLRVNHI